MPAPKGRPRGDHGEDQQARDQGRRDHPALDHGRISEAVDNDFGIGGRGFHIGGWDRWTVRRRSRALPFSLP